MAAPNQQQQVTTVPIMLAGGCKFGRYPKISQEQTWNFIVSDNFLVPYAGYKELLELSANDVGRGDISTNIGDFVLVAIGSVIWQIDFGFSNITFNFVGDLATNNGDVYMAENNNQQILITDGIYIYVWDYGSQIFYSSVPGATNAISFPFSSSGYCAFHNGRFLVCINGTQTWVLSLVGNATQSNFFANTPAQVGSIQTKPGLIQAILPMPGGGNNILVMGSNVCEIWQDIGAATFPYQRNSTFNIDYGCINPATVASMDKIIVWVAVNDLSGPVIMMTDGSQFKRISNDGIDFKLGNLRNAYSSVGFLFRQDGHLIYQFTFPDDNISLCYDFNTELFSYVTDDNLDYHPARQIVFFHNEYYFVSLNDGNFYQFGTQFTCAEYINGPKVIARIRVLPPVRMPSQRYFIGNSLGFTIENGQQNTWTPILVPAKDGIILTTEGGIQLITENNVLLTTEPLSDMVPINDLNPFTSDATVQLSISTNGGMSFSSSYSLPMNQTGNYVSRLIFYQLGIMNDVTSQLRFNSLERFVVTDGELTIYQ